MELVLLIHVLAATALGYLTARITKRPWLGWLVGIGFFVWRGVFTPWEFG